MRLEKDAPGSSFECMIKCLLAVDGVLQRQEEKGRKESGIWMTKRCIEAEISKLSREKGPERNQN